MAAILILFSIIAFLAGLGIFSGSTSVLHEMFGGILLVISSIFFAGAFIVIAIDSMKSKHTELLTQIKDELKKLNMKG